MDSPIATPDFSPLALSVVLLVYRRTDLLREQLRRLSDQSIRSSYEIILWNNGAPLAAELEGALRVHARARPLTIVQSSTNYVGRARFAAAEIARGRLLFLCDDDIVPRDGYLQGFVDRFESYGKPVVLCGSGHVFVPPRVPAGGVAEGLPLGRGHAETPVHYAHANSLLTSTDVFRRAARIPMPEPGYNWIDDLWLSYVWTVMLDIPLVKIKADHLYDEHPSSRDPDLALSRSPLVREQQQHFLRDYQGRSGWPTAGGNRSPD